MSGWRKPPVTAKPALAYDRNSKGSVAYLALAGEILRQEKAAQSTETTGSRKKINGGKTTESWQRIGCSSGIPEDAETLQDQAVIDSSQELLHRP